jgi:hypothetical protein
VNGNGAGRESLAGAGERESHAGAGERDSHAGAGEREPQASAGEREPQAYERRLCPSCGADEPRAAVTSRRPAAALSFDDLRSHWRGFFKESIFFDYCRCTACGQLYCPHYFSRSQLGELYREMADNTADVDVTPLQRTQERYAATLKALRPPTGDYVEVGPDIGLLTEAVLAAGGVGDIYLFEPNRSVWPELERKFGADHCHLSAEMETYDEVAPGSSALATMVHVLDHLLDPLTVVRGLASRLMPGGLLGVVTHDESSLLARALCRRWPAYCLQHPQLFRPATARALLERAGLDVVYVGKTANVFPLAYLTRHALFAARLPSTWLDGRKGPALPLKLGNVMTVARRAHPQPESADK